jgi:hypothetical protein
MDCMNDISIGDHVLDDDGNDVEVVDIIERKNRKNIVEIYDEKNDEFKVVYERPFKKIDKNKALS